MTDINTILVDPNGLLGNVEAVAIIKRLMNVAARWCGTFDSYVDRVCSNGIKAKLLVDQVVNNGCNPTKEQIAAARAALLSARDATTLALNELDQIEAVMERKAGIRTTQVVKQIFAPTPTTPTPAPTTTPVAASTNGVLHEPKDDGKVGTHVVEVPAVISDQSQNHDKAKDDELPAAVPAEIPDWLRKTATAQGINLASLQQTA